MRSAARDLPWARLLYWLAGTCVLVLVWRVYASASHGLLIWDDHILAHDKRGVLDAFTHPFWREGTVVDGSPPYYRPVVVLSYQFDRALGGSPSQLHVTNLLVHLLACTFLVLFAYRLGAKPAAAIVAGAIWALLPRLSESVAWISGRTDLLAAAFGFAALLTSPLVTELGQSRSTRLALATASGFLVFLALSSKEVAMAFVAVILIATGRSVARAALAAVNVAAPVLAYLILRTITLPDVTSNHTLGVPARAALCLEAIGRYVEISVDALHPSASIGSASALDRGRVVFGALALVGVVVGAVLARRRRATNHTRAATAALTLTVASIAPAIHIIPLHLAGAVVADRLLYVPLAGLAIGGAVLASSRPWTARTRTIAGAIVLGLVALFAHVTSARAAVYVDEATFWVTAAEEAHHENTTPMSALAGVVRDTGEVELACRLFEAAYGRLAANPDASPAARRRTAENLAGCYALSDRFDESVTLLSELVAREPAYAHGVMALGFARLHVFDFGGATTDLDRALAIDPSLRPQIEPALASFPETQREWGRIRSNDPRDRLAKARLLARVGRSLEAQRAFLEVAADTSQNDDARLEARAFLLRYGTIENLEEAARVAGMVKPYLIFRDKLAARRDAHDRVAALHARIEALVDRSGR